MGECLRLSVHKEFEICRLEIVNVQTLPVCDNRINLDQLCINADDVVLIRGWLSRFSR